MAVGAWWDFLYRWDDFLCLAWIFVSPCDLAFVCVGRLCLTFLSCIFIYFASRHLKTIWAVARLFFLRVNGVCSKQKGRFPIGESLNDVIFYWAREGERLCIFRYKNWLLILALLSLI